MSSTTLDNTQLSLNDGTTSTSADQVKSSTRISELDTLRGLAVLGILLLNIVSFGLPRAYADPTIFGGSEGWNLFAYGINNLFFEGSMRGLFSLMFGASVLLLTQSVNAKKSDIGVADIYYRRMLWLFVFGVVHGWGLLWFGDVLYWYALAGMFLFPLRNLSPKWLIIIGVILLSTAVPRSLIKVVETVDAQATSQVAEQLIKQGEQLDPEHHAAMDLWQSIQGWRKPGAEELERQIDALRGDYWSVLSELTPTIMSYQSTILYQGGFFDAIGFMLIGMALVKLGVLTGRRSKRFYFNLTCIGFALGVTINAFELKALIANNFDIVSTLKWGFLGVLYDAARLPVTLGHLGLVMLICKMGWFSRATGLLAAVGKMALTNYVMHSLLCAIIFYGFGFALYGQLERYELYFVVFAIWAFQLVGSAIWLRYFRLGPLEWVWRSLTYWQSQPLKRSPH